MDKKKKRKELYKDIEFFLSYYKALKPRLHGLDKTIEELMKELEKLKASTTLKAGKALLYIPKKLKHVTGKK